MSSSSVTEAVPHKPKSNSLASSSPRRYRPHTLLQWIKAWWLSVVCVLVVRIESTDRWSATNTKHEFYGWFNHHIWVVSWDRWGLINWEFRKLGHLSGFGLIGLAFYYCWLHSLMPRTREPITRFRRRCALRAVVLAFLLAASDEIHQSFIPSRTAAVHDVVLDTFGALLAIIFFLGLQAFFRPDSALNAREAIA